jgi:hypothetical protein
MVGDAMASFRRRVARGVGLVWRERSWLAAFAVLLTLCRLPNVDGWDDAFYVGQLTSALGDRDLRLQDDVVLVPKAFSEKCRILTSVLPSGALVNTFSIGPAVILSPFVLGVVSTSSPPPWQAFRALAALAAMGLLVLTAFSCVRVVRRFGVGEDDARLATGLALLSSPLALYATRYTLNAHTWAGLLLTLTLHQALIWLESRRTRNAVALGLAAGLACVNRWQDAVVVLPLLAVAALLAARSGSPWRSGTVLIAATAALTGACQLLAWWIQFGTPFLLPQGGGYMRWLSPAVLPLLFSTYHGLLPWAPGLALGIAALAIGVLARGRSAPQRWLLAAAALGSLLAIYVSACAEDWWGRDSFGPRRLASLAPIAAIGLGLLLKRLSPRWRVLLALLLCGWAVLTISADFSGHDDLRLLLTGQPDAFRPAEAAARTGPTWRDSWGVLHALKPGFSFTDAPRLADRLLGIASVALLVIALRLALPLLASRAWAQRLALGMALLVVAAWLQLLAFAPSNREWNAQWRAFLQAPFEPARAQALGAEMATARDVVVAARAAELQDGRTLALAIERLRGRGIMVRPDEAASCRPAR